MSRLSFVHPECQSGSGAVRLLAVIRNDKPYIAYRGIVVHRITLLEIPWLLQLEGLGIHVSDTVINILAMHFRIV